MYAYSFQTFLLLTMLYYQIEICIYMYKHVYWLCAPHSYNPMGCPSSRIHPGASA